MKDKTYEIRILVNGRPAKEFTHDNKTFVESRIGTEYSIQIKNNDWQRVLAVPTVDGINVISGEPDSGEPGEGYIVNGNSSVTIKGFRKDLDSVGAFKFCRKDFSYCNEAGAPGNNGVIGVQIFSEKPRASFAPLQNWLSTNTHAVPNFRECSALPDTHPGVPCEYDRYRDAIPQFSSNCSSGSNSSGQYSSTVNYSGKVSVVNNVADAFGVGTTWGTEQISKVTLEEFEINCNVSEMCIYYASVTGLKKLGVPLVKKESIGFPKAFGSFAKPPKSWKG